MNALSGIVIWLTHKGAAVEKAYPLVLTALVAVALWKWTFVPTQANLSNLLSAVISVAAIMAGFFATAKAILLSLTNEKTVAELKKEGRFQTLVGFFWTGVRAQLFLAAYAGTGFFVIDKYNEPWFRHWFVGLEIAAVFMAFASYRALHLLAKLLRLVSAGA